MALVVAAVFVLVVAVLATATRRKQVVPCCAPADPKQDLRMRAAFTDEGRDAQSS